MSRAPERYSKSVECRCLQAAQTDLSGLAPKSGVRRTGADAAWVGRLSVNRFNGELVLGKARKRLLIVDRSFQDDFAPPELTQILKRFLGIFELKIAPVMAMFDKEPAVVVVISVLDLDH